MCECLGLHRAFDKQGENKMSETKSIWKSKTLWFNIISFAVLVISAFAIPSLFNEKVVVILGSIVTIGNGLLRMITAQAVSFN